MNDKKQIIFFDMGNVILPFDHDATCRLISEKYDIDRQKVYDCIFASGLEKKFETGLISGEEFYEICCESLETEFDFAEFKEYCSAIFTENPAVSQIIRDLKPTTELVLLSNTNPWHFGWAKDTFDVLSLFDEYILSYETKAMKPDVKIFSEALKKADNYQKIVYTDDIQEYVTTSQDLGLPAILFQDADLLRSELEDRGFFLDHNQPTNPECNSVDNDKKLIELIKCNWDHGRHLENLRMKLAAMYTGGMFALLLAQFKIEDIEAKLLSAIIGILLTLICTIATYKWNYEFKNQIQKADRCARKIFVTSDNNHKETAHSLLGFPIREDRLSWINVRLAYILLYSLFFTVWCTFLIASLYEIIKAFWLLYTIFDYSLGKILFS